VNTPFCRIVGSIVLVFSVVAAVVAIDPAAAHADTSLLAWTAQADANPFDLVIDNANGLDGSHPLAEMDIPEDSSNFETGPLGYALASILWPGAIGGSLGSVLGEAGLPSSLTPLANQLNDPVKAESFYPAGPLSATYPPGAATAGVFEMQSHADASQSWAKAGVTDALVSGLFNLQNVQGSTVATATTQAQSTASGTFSSLNLLGGLIHIGASEFSASAHSDGVNPAGTSTTNIGAITIGGYQVSVGSNGLTLGPASANVSSLLQIPMTLVDQVISALNLKIAVLADSQSSNAPTEEVQSGGLSISFSLPSSLSLSLNCSTLPAALDELNTVCHVPDELQGLRFALTLGRVTATAIAAQPFALAVAPGLGPISNLFVAGSSPTFEGLGAGPPAPFTAVPTTTTSTSSPAVAKRVSTGVLAVALSSPVGVSLLVLLLFLAAAFGLGFRRLTTAMAAKASTDRCPLEEDP
jgi:hypothetical protein